MSLVLSSHSRCSEINLLKNTSPWLLLSPAPTGTHTRQAQCSSGAVLLSSSGFYFPLPPPPLPHLADTRHSTSREQGGTRSSDSTLGPYFSITSPIHEEEKRETENSCHEAAPALACSPFTLCPAICHLVCSRPAPRQEPHWDIPCWQCSCPPRAAQATGKSVPWLESKALCKQSLQTCTGIKARVLSGLLQLI